MNISVKETTVFSVFHPDAQDLYNTCSDLKKVAWELWDQSYRLNAEVRLVWTLGFYLFDHWVCTKRTKLSNYSTHLHQCCVRDLPRKLKSPSERWVDPNLLSRKSLMGKECNFIRGVTNISIVQGLLLPLGFPIHLHLTFESLGKERIILTYTENISDQEV